jgi:hypothetical protein
VPQRPLRRGQVELLADVLLAADHLHPVLAADLRLYGDWGSEEPGARLSEGP